MSGLQPDCGQWLPPQCETCGVELTSGFMAAWCPRAKACKHDPVRWVMSGGSPVSVAHPCSGNCPLKVPGTEYGPLIVGTCKVCGRGTIRETTGPKPCLDCGTEFRLVLNT